jgi:isocitrate dehydrogenase
LDNNRSPSRKVGELDNRGSHFYLTLYWAQALANQNKDQELKVIFTKVAKELEENESKIVSELNAAQGTPNDIGGYYMPNVTLMAKEMRPSATFNAILNQI